MAGTPSKATDFCSKCGNKIVGMTYTYRTKNYCHTCFQTLQKDLEQVEQQKQHLYTFIKGMFEVSELPESVINAVDHEMAAGKKPAGMELTLKYYYQIEGHPLGPVSNVGFVIRDYYEAARKYNKEMRELSEKNARVDINVEPVTVVIDPRKTYTPRPSIPYRMEDL